MTEHLIIGWIVLCVVMLVHRRMGNESVTGRAPGTWLGIFVQAIGFSVIWTMRRDATSIPEAARVIMSGVSDVCGLAAVILAVAAIWTLGRQWSVEGRVLRGHKLLKHGPYGCVRHPIYAAMFGMLLATGLSMSSVSGLAAGVALFVLGTMVRVHYEERLLRERFGSEFERYAATVPAFVPFVRDRRSDAR